MGPTALKVKKKTYTDKTKLNSVARDDTLRSYDTKRSVQETEQYLYNFFLPLIHRNVQLSWARSQQLVRDASMCSGIVE